MNRKRRDKMMYMGWIIQKLADFICEMSSAPTKDKKQFGRMQMAYRGAKAYFDSELDEMTEDEKLKLKTDMERKAVQIDYRKSLEFESRMNDSKVMVSPEELCTLAGYSIDYACHYCDRNPQEQRICSLRETLIRCNAVEGIDLGNKKKCPYHGLCAQDIVDGADQRLHDKWERANTSNG